MLKDRVLNLVVGIILILSLVFNCIICIRIGTWYSKISILLSLYSLFTIRNKMMKYGVKSYKHIFDEYKYTEFNKKIQKIIFSVLISLFIIYCIIKGIKYLANEPNSYIVYITYVFGTFVNTLNYAKYYDFCVQAKNWIINSIKKFKLRIKKKLE